jgi:hypothetical protein
MTMAAKRDRDRIWLDSRAVGGTRRTGEILETLGTLDRPRYRIRWEDGHESIVAPGSDARVSVERPAPARRTPARPRRKPRAATEAPKPPATRPTAAPGDRLVVRSHHVGEPERDAEILEVLGEHGRPPFRVRWQDTGHESVVFPGSDAIVEHFRHGRA